MSIGHLTYMQLEADRLTRIVLAGDITDEFTRRKIIDRLSDIGHDVVLVPSEDCSPPRLLRRRFTISMKSAIDADVVVVGGTDTTLVAWAAASAAVLMNIPLIMLGGPVNMMGRLIPDELIDFHLEDWRDLEAIIDQVRPAA